MGLLGLLLLNGQADAALGTGRPLAKQAFAGLKVRDNAAGDELLIGWVLPGPLEGRTFKSPHMNRGDVILSVDGKKLNAAAFDKLIESSKPGDVLMLEVRQTGSKKIGAVPDSGKGAKVVNVKLVLASKADWVGPIDYPRPTDALPGSDPALSIEGPTLLERFLYKHLDKQKLRHPVEKLLGYFKEQQEEHFGFHGLSRVAYGFHHPMRLPVLQKAITDPLPAVARDPMRVFPLAARNLDLKRIQPKAAAAVDFAKPDDVLKTFAVALAQANGEVEKGFACLAVGEGKPGPIPFGRDSLRRDLDDIVKNASKVDYLSSHPEAARLIRALQKSMKVDFARLLLAAEMMGRHVFHRGSPPQEGLPAVPLPKDIGDAVTGEILAARKTPQGWLIYGGFGKNTYDMSRLAVVVDAGGDDRYRYPDKARPIIQTIVDLAGDDTHAGNGPGPASAELGVSLLVDYAGDDRYSGGRRSCGVGMMGVGILLDYGGNDTYRGTAWSQGAGFYGMGAILDLGRGRDAYDAQIMSQGIGGPRGFGLILDSNGRDFYRVNGPTPSAYGTPAVYCGFSQGMGWGIRGYESGGIGVLADLGGNDRYDAGEFSQGGGYSWGLGILYDRRGNDLYYGNHYGQGFGCHQALGILADDAGDDTYWTMNSATQGGSWDVGMGLLIDRAGNDSYQAEGHSQGAAAMQGIAWLIDAAGTDRYVATSHGTHGQSLGNSYHYAQSGCFSWSLLLDAGGTTDIYSTGRPNSRVLAPGSYNKKAPRDSLLHGLFIDTAEKVRLE